MTDPLIGKIYYAGRFPNTKPRLIKISKICYDPAYMTKVMVYKTNDGEEHLDRFVFTRCYRFATEEEILLYWNEHD